MKCLICHHASRHVVHPKSKFKNGSWDILSCPECPRRICRK